MKLFFAKYGRTIGGTLLCVLAVILTVVFGGFNRPVQSADVLSGKWTGNVEWASASGRDFSRTMHTALIFQPDHTVWTVFTLPSGALGGTGTYTLKDGHLTIHSTGLSINSHPLPQTLFAHQPWFHDTATYAVTFDGTNLTLAQPPAHAGARASVSAPAYPLLVSGKPLVFSRVEEPIEEKPDPAPKE